MNRDISISRNARIPILNVEVDNITMDELVTNFDNGALLTLHVDMIMKLQKDRDFYDILSEFDIITCDSQILYFAARILGTPFMERVSGADFFPRYYMHHRNSETVKIFLCGGNPGVAEIAQSNINARVGREIIVGTCSPPFDFDHREEEIDKIVDQVNATRATVLLVGLGSGRQEKFIVKNRDRFEHVKTFLPLGGTIDYEAKTLKRPPAWISNMGLEWLYRLVIEPRRRWYRYLVHQPPVLYYLLAQKLGFYKNPFATATNQYD